MIHIQKAVSADAGLLVELGAQTFRESHGHSAAVEDIDSYINSRYHIDTITQELQDPRNTVHILYYDEQPAGFSKIVFNSPSALIQETAVTKLERLYLLSAYYDLRLGQQLFDFNVQLSRRAGQQGMWLYAWTENHRAVRFYEKNGFVVVGHSDFRISATHSNPNHIMYLRWE